MGQMKGKSLLVDENVSQDDAKRAMGILAAVFSEDSMLLVAQCTFGGKPGALLGARLEDGGVIPMAIIIGDANVGLLTEINGDTTPVIVKSQAGHGDGGGKLGELLESGQDLGAGGIIVGGRINGSEMRDVKKLRKKIKAKEAEAIAKAEQGQEDEGSLPKWSF